MWKNDFSIQQINEMCKSTIHESLGIQITKKGIDSLEGVMPVDSRTVQPMRILHGGANVVLAESLGSIASLLMINSDAEISVGLEINANHIRSVKTGFVYGVARPINIGRKIQVWEIKLSNEEGKLSCVSRLTVSVLKNE